jgi:K+-transporting ATPase ATPase A chain
VSYGFANNPNPAPEAIPWDIAAGLVMLFGRYLPILAMMAMAASLGVKKAAPFGVGTLRDDTLTFAILLLGTVLIVGALLFLPVAALGPLAEHFGPIPFGG